MYFPVFFKKKVVLPGCFSFFCCTSQGFPKKTHREVQLSTIGKYNPTTGSTTRPREVQQIESLGCTSRCFLFFDPPGSTTTLKSLLYFPVFFFSTEGKAPKAHRKHEGTYDAPKWSPPEAPSQLTSACYQSRLARFCFCYLCCCCCC